MSMDDLRALVDKARATPEAEPEIQTADLWLAKIEGAGRELCEPPEGIDMLDDIEKRSSRPTVGWFERNTKSLAR